MTVIDLSEQTDEIRCRYWEYWRSDKAPENCQPVTPRKITTASGKPHLPGLKCLHQEAAMGMPAYQQTTTVQISFTDRSANSCMVSTILILG